MVLNRSPTPSGRATGSSQAGNQEEDFGNGNRPLQGVMEDTTFFNNWNVKGDKAASFKRSVDLMAKEIKIMADSVIPNTKTEIRNGIDKALNMMKRIQKDIMEVVIMDNAKLKEIENRGKAQVADEAKVLQTLPINLTIDDATDIEVVKNLTEKNWSENVYNKVKVLGGDPVGCEGENSVFWFDHDSGKNQTLLN